MSSIQGLNHLTRGPVSVSIRGDGMGMVENTGRTREGKTGCEATNWISETSIQCRPGQAVKSSRRFVQTGGVRVGSITHAISVDAAGLSAMQGVNKEKAKSALITVHGVSMGFVGYTGRVRGGNTGCEGTDWMSETSIRCRIGQLAEGSRKTVVTIGANLGSLIRAWSADTGSLSIILGTNHPTVNTWSFTINGAGIGAVAYTVRARGGHTGCEGTEWDSETSVR